MSCMHHKMYSIPCYPNENRYYGIYWTILPVTALVLLAAQCRVVVPQVVAKLTLLVNGKLLLSYVISTTHRNCHI